MTDPEGSNYSSSCSLTSATVGTNNRGRQRRSYGVGIGRLVLAAAAILLAAARPAAQQPTLQQILARASQYVALYTTTLSNVVAEERYEQHIVEVRRALGWPANVGLQSAPFQTIGGRRRVLRSDVELINVGPPVGWRTYRDVFEVDGRPVRDRRERLTSLLLQPAADARAQANRIAEESARFNISDLGRTLNEPGLPIAFLRADVQPRFQFTFDRRDGTVWIVKYAERAVPTLFQHNYVENNPSSGRVWIDAATGAVLETEQIVSPADLHATFTTEFRRHATLGIAVPTEMREQLTTPLGDGEQRVEGTAKYSNYRKFGVTTQEDLRTP
jgi:hypothetical protein